MFATQWPLKRFYKFVLKRVLGKYLSTELDLDQLDVQVGAGIIELKDLQLNADVLNDLVEDLPITIVSGFVGQIRATIPWKKITKDNCKIELNHIQVTAIPKSELSEAVYSMYQSTHSLSKSVEVPSQSIVEDDDFFGGGDGYSSSDDDEDSSRGVGAKDNEDDQPGSEGYRVLSKMIEKILAEIHVRVNNLTVGLEHMDPDTGRRSVLLFRIPFLDYCDETHTPEEQRNDLFLPPVRSKSVKFRKFQVQLLEEYMPESPTIPSSPDGKRAEFSLLESSVLYPRSDEVPTLLTADAAQNDWMRFKIRVDEGRASRDHSDTMPKIEADLFFRQLELRITPRQFSLLSEMLDALSAAPTEDSLLLSPKKQQFMSQTNGEETVPEGKRKEFNSIDDILNDLTVNESGRSSSHQTRGCNVSCDESGDEFYECEDNGSGTDESGGGGGGVGTMSPVSLQLKLHVAKACASLIYASSLSTCPDDAMVWSLSADDMRGGAEAQRPEGMHMELSHITLDVRVSDKVATSMTIGDAVVWESVWDARDLKGAGAASHNTDNDEGVFHSPASDVRPPRPSFRSGSVTTPAHVAPSTPTSTSTSGASRPPSISVRPRSMSEEVCAKVLRQHLVLSFLESQRRSGGWNGEGGAGRGWNSHHDHSSSSTAAVSQGWQDFCSRTAGGPNVGEPVIKITLEDTSDEGKEKHAKAFDNADKRSGHVSFGGGGGAADGSGGVGGGGGGGRSSKDHSDDINTADSTIAIELDPCTLEFDPSMLTRLELLFLNPSPGSTGCGPGEDGADDDNHNPWSEAAPRRGLAASGLFGTESLYHSTQMQLPSAVLGGDHAPKGMTSQRDVEDIIHDLSHQTDNQTPNNQGVIKTKRITVTLSMLQLMLRVPAYEAPGQKGLSDHCISLDIFCDTGRGPSLVADHLSTMVPRDHNVRGRGPSLSSSVMTNNASIDSPLQQVSQWAVRVDLWEAVGYLGQFSGGGGATSPSPTFPGSGGASVNRGERGKRFLEVSRLVEGDSVTSPFIEVRYCTDKADAEFINHLFGEFTGLGRGSGAGGVEEVDLSDHHNPHASEKSDPSQYQPHHAAGMQQQPPTIGSVGNDRVESWMASADDQLEEIRFRTKAIASSPCFVTAFCPLASVHLTKAEYDHVNVFFDRLIEAMDGPSAPPNSASNEDETSDLGGGCVVDDPHAHHPDMDTFSEATSLATMVTDATTATAPHSGRTDGKGEDGKGPAAGGSKSSGTTMKVDCMKGSLELIEDEASNDDNLNKDASTPTGAKERFRYLVDVKGFELFQVSQHLGQPVSHTTLAMEDIQLYEIGPLNSSTSAHPSQSSQQDWHWGGSHKPKDARRRSSSGWETDARERERERERERQRAWERENQFEREVLFRTKWPQERDHTMCFSLSYVTKDDLEVNLRDKILTLTFRGLTLKHCVGSTWIDRVMDLLVTPDIPDHLITEQVRERVSHLMVFVNINDAVIDYTPIHLNSRALISLHTVRLSSQIIQGSPTVSTKVEIQEASAYLTDDKGVISKDSVGKHPDTPTLDDFLQSLGFVRVAMSDYVQVKIRTNKEAAESGNSEAVPLQVDISNNSLTVMVCEDSLYSLTTLFNYWFDSRDLVPVQDVERGSADACATKALAEGGVAGSHPVGGVEVVDHRVDGRTFSEASGTRGTTPAPLHGGETAGATPAETLLDTLDHQTFQARSDSGGRGGAPSGPGVNPPGMIEDYLREVDRRRHMDEGGYGRGTASSGGEGLENDPLNVCVKGDDGMWTALDRGALDEVVRKQQMAVSDIERQSATSGLRLKSFAAGPSEMMGGYYRGLSVDGSHIVGDMDSQEDGGGGEVEVEVEVDMPADAEEAARWFDDVGPAVITDFWDVSTHPSEEDMMDTMGDLPPVEMLMRLKDFGVTIRLFGGSDWGKIDEGEEEVDGGGYNGKEERDPDEIPLGGSSEEFWGAHHSHLQQQQPHQRDSADNERGNLKKDRNSFSSTASGTAGVNIMGGADVFEKRPAAAVGGGVSGGISSSSNMNKSKSTPRQGKRLTDQVVECHLGKISLSHKTFVPGHLYQQRTVLKIRDVNIVDCILTSRWSRMFGYLVSSNPREDNSKMIEVEIDVVRPITAPHPSAPGEDAGVGYQPPASATEKDEYRLRIKLLPMRLNIDQDALNFLLNMFTYNPPKAYLPPLYESTPLFFQLVETNSIRLKMDYKPKRLDIGRLRDGDLSELINLSKWEGVQLHFNKIKLRGVQGWDGLAEGLKIALLPEVKTQAYKALCGLQPIRSLVNVGNGMIDLVVLPIEQYKKDRRLVKGLRSGARSFLRNISLETINWTRKAASGAHEILEGAEALLKNPQDQHRPTPPTTAGSSAAAQLESKQPPGDITEGLHQAYESMSRGFSRAHQIIFAVPAEDASSGSGGGQYPSSSGGVSGVTSVLKAVPIAVLQPMIGVTDAVAKGLTGVGNTLDPTGRDEVEGKYKSHR